jgi:cobalt-zinc-cadmium efflux system membrane fusion protein
MKMFNIKNGCLVLLSIVILQACGNKEAMNVTSESHSKSEDSMDFGIVLSDSQQRVAKIKLANMEQQKLGGSIRLVGEVVAAPTGFESVVVPVGGIIQSIKVKPGDQVKLGQVLFTLAGSSVIEWQEQYLESAQQLKLMQSNWERDKQLFEKRAISERQWQESQSQFQIADSKYKAFKAKLALLGISTTTMGNGNIQSVVSMRSPADGMVEKVALNQGDFANSDAVVIRLTKPSAQQWVIRALPQDVDMLSVGNRCVCTFVNGKSVETKISSMASELGANNLINVYVQSILGKGWTPRFGSSFSAQVYLNDQQNWVLPTAAVIESDGKKYCFVSVKSGVFRLTEIETLGSADGFWIIKKPLNDKVVMEGAYWIWMQMNQSEE